MRIPPGLCFLKSRGEEAVEGPPARVHLIAFTGGLDGLRARRKHLHRDLVRQRAPRVKPEVEGPVLDGDLGFVRPGQEFRVAKLQFEFRGLQRPVAGSEHRRPYQHVEVQALGEPGYAYVRFRLRDLVLTPVEVERSNGELRMHLASVSDLRAGSSEGDQLVHELSLLLVIVPGRPAAWYGHAARPRGACRGCLRGWRGPHQRNLPRRAGSPARGGGRPP